MRHYNIYDLLCKCHAFVWYKLEVVLILADSQANQHEYLVPIWTYTASAECMIIVFHVQCPSFSPVPHLHSLL